MAAMFSRFFVTLLIVLQVAFSAALFPQESFERNDSSVTVFLPKGAPIEFIEFKK